MTRGLDDRQRALLQEVLARHGLDQTPHEPDALADVRAADEGQPLTLRQLQVLALIAEGYSNMRIALAFQISHETVKTHVKNVLRALPANDRAHAVAQGFRKGLIE